VWRAKHTARCHNVALTSMLLVQQLRLPPRERGRPCIQQARPRDVAAVPSVGPTVPGTLVRGQAARRAAFSRMTVSACSFAADTVSFSGDLGSLLSVNDARNVATTLP